MHRVFARIVGLNSKYCHSSLAPWCLLAGVRAYGGGAVDARVTEGTVNEADDVLVERLCEGSPDVVCVCCYIWNINTVLRVCERVHAVLPRTRIVLGGPEVAYRAADILTRYPWVYCVMSGEGERQLA